MRRFKLLPRKRNIRNYRGTFDAHSYTGCCHWEDSCNGGNVTGTEGEKGDPVGSCERGEKSRLHSEGRVCHNGLIRKHGRNNSRGNDTKTWDLCKINDKGLNNGNDSGRGLEWESCSRKTKRTNNENGSKTGLRWQAYRRKEMGGANSEGKWNSWSHAVLCEDDRSLEGEAIEAEWSNRSNSAVTHGTPHEVAVAAPAGRPMRTRRCSCLDYAEGHTQCPTAACREGCSSPRSAVYSVPCSNIPVHASSLPISFYDTPDETSFFGSLQKPTAQPVPNYGAEKKWDDSIDPFTGDCVAKETRSALFIRRSITGLTPREDKGGGGALRVRWGEVSADKCSSASSSSASREGGKQSLFAHDTRWSFAPASSAAAALPRTSAAGVARSSTTTEAHNTLRNSARESLAAGAGSTDISSGVFPASSAVPASTSTMTPVRSERTTVRGGACASGPHIDGASRQQSRNRISVSGSNNLNQDDRSDSRVRMRLLKKSMSNNEREEVASNGDNSDSWIGPVKGNVTHGRARASQIHGVETLRAESSAAAGEAQNDDGGSGFWLNSLPPQGPKERLLREYWNRCVANLRKTWWPRLNRGIRIGAITTLALHLSVSKSLPGLGGILGQDWCINTYSLASTVLPEQSGAVISGLWVWVFTLACIAMLTFLLFPVLGFGAALGRVLCLLLFLLIVSWLSVMRLPLIYKVPPFDADVNTHSLTSFAYLYIPYTTASVILSQQYRAFDTDLSTGLQYVVEMNTGVLFSSLLGWSLFLLQVVLPPWSSQRYIVRTKLSGIMRNVAAAISDISESFVQLRRVLLSKKLQKGNDIVEGEGPQQSLDDLRAASHALQRSCQPLYTAIGSQTQLRVSIVTSSTEPYLMYPGPAVFLFPFFARCCEVLIHNCMNVITLARHIDALARDPRPMRLDADAALANILLRTEPLLYTTMTAYNLCAELVLLRPDTLHRTAFKAGLRAGLEHLDYIDNQVSATFGLLRSPSMQEVSAKQLAAAEDVSVCLQRLLSRVSVCSNMGGSCPSEASALYYPLSGASATFERTDQSLLRTWSQSEDLLPVRYGKGADRTAPLSKGIFFIDGQQMPEGATEGSVDANASIQDSQQHKGRGLPPLGTAPLSQQLEQDVDSTAAATTPAGSKRGGPLSSPRWLLRYFGLPVPAAGPSEASKITKEVGRTGTAQTATQSATAGNDAAAAAARGTSHAAAAAAGLEVSEDSFTDQVGQSPSGDASSVLSFGLSRPGTTLSMAANNAEATSTAAAISRATVSATTDKGAPMRPAGTTQGAALGPGSLEPEEPLTPGKILGGTTATGALRVRGKGRDWDQNTACSLRLELHPIAEEQEQQHYKGKPVAVRTLSEKKAAGSYVDYTSTKETLLPILHKPTEVSSSAADGSSPPVATTSATSAREGATSLSTSVRHSRTAEVGESPVGGEQTTTTISGAEEGVPKGSRGSEEKVGSRKGKEEEPLSVSHHDPVSSPASSLSSAAPLFIPVLHSLDVLSGPSSPSDGGSTLPHAANMTGRVSSSHTSYPSPDATETPSAPRTSTTLPLHGNPPSFLVDAVCRRLPSPSGIVFFRSLTSSEVAPSSDAQAAAPPLFLTVHAECASPSGAPSTPRRGTAVPAAVGASSTVTAAFPATGTNSSPSPDSFGVVSSLSGNRGSIAAPLSSSGPSSSSPSSSSSSEVASAVGARARLFDAIPLSQQAGGPLVGDTSPGVVSADLRSGASPVTASSAVTPRVIVSNGDPNKRVSSPVQGSLSPTEAPHTPDFAMAAGGNTLSGLRSPGATSHNVDGLDGPDSTAQRGRIHTEAKMPAALSASERVNAAPGTAAKDKDGAKVLWNTEKEGVSPTGASDGGGADAGTEALAGSRFNNGAHIGENIPLRDEVIGGGTKSKSGLWSIFSTGKSKEMNDTPLQNGGASRTRLQPSQHEDAAHDHSERQGSCARLIQEVREGLGKDNIYTSSSSGSLSPSTPSGDSSVSSIDMDAVLTNLLQQNEDNGETDTSGAPDLDRAGSATSPAAGPRASPVAGVTGGRTGAVTSPAVTSHAAAATDTPSGLRAAILSAKTVSLTTPFASTSTLPRNVEASAAGATSASSSKMSGAAVPVSATAASVIPDASANDTSPAATGAGPVAASQAVGHLDAAGFVGGADGKITEAIAEEESRVRGRLSVNLHRLLSLPRRSVAFLTSEKTGDTDSSKAGTATTAALSAQEITRPQKRSVFTSPQETVIAPGERRDIGTSVAPKGRRETTHPTAGDLRSSVLRDGAAAGHGGSKGSMSPPVTSILGKKVTKGKSKKKVVLHTPENHSADEKVGGDEFPELGSPGGEGTPIASVTPQHLKTKTKGSLAQKERKRSNVKESIFPWLKKESTKPHPPARWPSTGTRAPWRLVSAQRRQRQREDDLEALRILAHRNATEIRGSVAYTTIIGKRKRRGLAPADLSTTAELRQELRVSKLIVSLYRICAMDTQELCSTVRGLCLAVLSPSWEGARQNMKMMMLSLAMVFIQLFFGLRNLVRVDKWKWRGSEAFYRDVEAVHCLKLVFGLGVLFGCCLFYGAQIDRFLGGPMISGGPQTAKQWMILGFLCAHSFTYEGNTHKGLKRAVGTLLGGLAAELALMATSNYVLLLLFIFLSIVVAVFVFASPDEPSSEFDKEFGYIGQVFIWTVTFILNIIWVYEDLVPFPYLRDTVVRSRICGNCVGIGFSMVLTYVPPVFSAERAARTYCATLLKTCRRCIILMNAAFLSLTTAKETRETSPQGETLASTNESTYSSSSLLGPSPSPLTAINKPFHWARMWKFRRSRQLLRRRKEWRWMRKQIRDDKALQKDPKKACVPPPQRQSSERRSIDREGCGEELTHDAAVEEYTLGLSLEDVKRYGSTRRSSTPCRERKLQQRSRGELRAVYASAEREAYEVSAPCLRCAAIYFVVFDDRFHYYLQQAEQLLRHHSTRLLVVARMLYDEGASSEHSPVWRVDQDIGEIMNRVEYLVMSVVDAVDNLCQLAMGTDPDLAALLHGSTVLTRQSVLTLLQQDRRNWERVMRCRAGKALLINMVRMVKAQSMCSHLLAREIQAAGLHTVDRIINWELFRFPAAMPPKYIRAVLRYIEGRSSIERYTNRVYESLAVCGRELREQGLFELDEWKGAIFSVLLIMEKCETRTFFMDEIHRFQFNSACRIVFANESPQLVRELLCSLSTVGTVEGPGEEMQEVCHTSPRLPSASVARSALGEGRAYSYPQRTTAGTSFGVSVVGGVDKGQQKSHARRRRSV